MITEAYVRGNIQQWSKLVDGRGLTFDHIVSLCTLDQNTVADTRRLFVDTPRGRDLIASREYEDWSNAVIATRVKLGLSYKTRGEGVDIYNGTNLLVCDRVSVLRVAIVALLSDDRPDDLIRVADEAVSHLEAHVAAAILRRS